MVWTVAEHSRLTTEYVISLCTIIDISQQTLNSDAIFGNNELTKQQKQFEKRYRIMEYYARILLQVVL